jgi:hypothetical protein
LPDPSPNRSGTGFSSLLYKYFDIVENFPAMSIDICEKLLFHIKPNAGFAPEVEMGAGVLLNIPPSLFSLFR